MAKTTDDELDLDALEAQVSGKVKDEPKGDGLAPIHSFSIDVKDKRGKTWKGKFVFRVPSLGDQVKIANFKARLLPGGAMTDPNGALIAEMMAYCQVTFTAKPSWWQPARFYDPTPLIAAYKEARSYEDRFLGAAVADDPDDAEESGFGTDPSDPDDVG